MPRRSAASLSVAGTTGRPRAHLEPSAGASDATREVFFALLRDVPLDHFVTTDSPLLEAFASAVVMHREATAKIEAEGAVVNGKPSPWLLVREREGKALVNLSARLRLAPQTRTDSKAAGRRASGLRPSPYDGMDSAYSMEDH